MKSHSVLNKTQGRRQERCSSLPLLALAVVLVAGGASARAQQTGVSAAEQASRQAEAVRSQQLLQKQAQDEREKKAPSEDEPPETYPGENDDLGPQKLLKKKKRKPLFDFSSDTMLTWTTNALSSGRQKTDRTTGLKTDPARDSGVLAETLSLAFAPQPLDIGIGKLGIRAGYRHLLYAYNALQSSRLNKNSFEMGTAFVGTNLTFLDNWNASLGLDYNRILKLSSTSSSPFKHALDGGNLQESFVDWSPNWSLMRSITLTDKLSMMVMYSGAYHFTDVDPVSGKPRDGSNRNDKLDDTLMTSLMYSINSKWMLQSSFRVTHGLYTEPNAFEVHRRDITFSPGFSVIWTPAPQLSFRASAGGEFRKSNLNDGSAPDYRKFESAVGISAMLKF